MKLKKLKDQVVVITGASSGIGLATAKMAAKRGAKVVLASRNKKDLDRIVDEIESDGGEAFAVKCDVSKPEDMRRLKEQALQEFGVIDTWVNNAGVGIFGEVMDTPLEEARQMFDTNFWSIHYGCMEAIDAMKDGDGGVIINLGSEVSERSIPLQTFYASTKHAIKGYTEGLRSEIIARGYPIAFTLVRPAATDTPFTQHAPNHLDEGEPSLPAPVYHPDVIANGICAAAETGKRDFYAGASKFFSVLNHMIPGLLDYGVNMQQKDQKKGTAKGPHTEDQTALMHSAREEGDMTGGHKGHVMKSSVWSSASLHPVVAVGALVGLGAVAYGAAAWANRE